MKTVIFLTLFCFLIPSSFAEITMTNQVAKDVGTTYGFFLGQEKSLEKISTEQPSLSGLALVAEKEFYANFGDAIENMDKRMSELGQDKWAKIKTDLQREISGNISNVNLSKADARAFIELVRNRAKGNIPSPISETLLIFKPRYQRHPASEFSDGYRQTYQSDGAGKAKGVKFNLEVPRSWKLLEGNRPNIVTKAVSENGRGLELFLVLIKSLPLPEGTKITEQDVADILNPSDMSDMLPSGAKYIASGKYTLETLPGYWARFEMNVTRGRQNIDMSGIIYTIFYENRMIQMQGQVANAPASGTKPGSRFENFEQLFDLISQSLVLPDIYGH